MAVRTIGTSSLPFTYVDLEGMPDDGCRYELSYGALVVTPAPNVRHQTLAKRVLLLLEAACPRGKVVLFDTALYLAADLVKIPDLVVFDEAGADARYVRDTADLVVEIHSPSTLVVDRTEKRAVYEAAGISSYWLVDPEAQTITVLELRDGAYVEAAVVGVSDVVEVHVPFPVWIEGQAVFG